MIRVIRVNELSDSEAFSALRNCCGASKWARLMLAARPFASNEDLFAKSASSFLQLEDSDWLEAFSHHPKIGDMDALREKFSSGTGWEAKEQASVAQADEEVLRELSAGNKAYEEKFGFIFIVCATGKSAAEMLSLLKARLGNTSPDEIKIAAAEQEKITKLRLEKLCQ